MRGSLLAGIAVAPDGAVAISPDDGSPDDGIPGRVTTIAEAADYERAVRPRWVTWSQETARRLVTGGLRVGTCWDVAAVHRMMFGGFRADPGYVWAHLRGLPPDKVPEDRAAADGPLDLFSSLSETGPDTDQPIGEDGYLRPEWTRGGWTRTPDTRLAWAHLARETAGLQRQALDGRRVDAAGAGIVRSESTVELLCAELAADGLPVDRAVAEDLLTGIIGPRPRDEREAAAIRAARDAEVLKHAPA
ncbi:MAG: hypothetical protein J2P26_03465, partial [Nocardiopsaceae bacterium]|nr:hypothetical protein [Nocardiopsaceae bacterium]